MPKLPNILITGTPGCGKSQHVAHLKELVDFKFYTVSDVVKEKGFSDGQDEFGSLFIDEDALLDDMEPIIAEGGCIVDHHTCGFFPERFFQLVVVLRTDISTLHARLEARGYPEAKVQNNVQCEIMDVVLNEAAESYDEDIIVELHSDTPEQVAENCQRVLTWISHYMKDAAATEAAGGTVGSAPRPASSGDDDDDEE